MVLEDVELSSKPVWNIVKDHPSGNFLAKNLSYNQTVQRAPGRGPGGMKWAPPPHPQPAPTHQPPGWATFHEALPGPNCLQVTAVPQTPWRWPLETPRIPTEKQRWEGFITLPSSQCLGLCSLPSLREQALWEVKRVVAPPPAPAPAINTRYPENWVQPAADIAMLSTITLFSKSSRSVSEEMFQIYYRNPNISLSNCSDLLA